MKGKLISITNAGKITVTTGIFALLVISLLSTIGFVSSNADAKSATSTVKVLNTPPQYKGDAFEIATSSQATPTTYGNTVAFSVPATDSSNNGMYLLVCKTGGAPTASSSTAPSCAGGASNVIAVSAAPTVGSYPAISMLYATSSPISDTVNETQAWFAFLCDNDSRTPRCSISNQGTGVTDSASPYYINHPHSFDTISQNGPTAPGGTMTFTTTLSEVMHVDVNGPADTVKLFLCKLADFNGSTCGAGGTWASTTVGVATNPQAQLTFTIPYQDNNYSGYAYAVDSHNAVAVGTKQGSIITFAVSNVAPQVTASSITFTPSNTFTITNPLGLNTGYGVDFTTTDNNSCVSTSTAPEMKTVRVQIGRNSLFGTTCKETDAFNSNNCYNSDVSTSTWNLVCVQNVASCTDNNDTSVNWNCTFPLWSNVDPTDAQTPWTGDNWNARISVGDDNGLSGTSTIDSAARYATVVSFPFIDLGSNTIDFGEFEPGATPPDLGTGAVGSVLGVLSKGNTAFDLNMQTSDMCPNYSNGCTGNETTDTIFGNRQHYATTSIPYWSPLSATGTTSTLSAFEINIKKPTATGTATSKNINWGILVPASITISGDYKGVNAIEFRTETTYASW